ncbi:MerR family transcriptional regulator [Pullulanibacillus sp. KACC 23026]|uniref:MerR family transcriptional regulator n=1 Tax=Pullulanibacillus sp. KACC 23026 TaxID=3028315 RepID=UPI0023B0C4EB|nr:MerR family transcriptional regulator [Pullulanibacillus sp. KACC 23026]WEG12036.1 MerR family transcriptional regulator [Pullulanibacillus sp. KACC 23026]
MERGFKIDEVAKQSGLSKRTIRYYEEIGLLDSPPRSKGGTRIYSDKHVELLKKVTTIKEVLGFSLQELVHYMSLRENFEQTRANYLQVKELKDSISEKTSLEEMGKTLDKQILVIEDKMQKILSVQKELVTLRERVRARIGSLEQELEMKRGESRHDATS